MTEATPIQLLIDKDMGPEELCARPVGPCRFVLLDSPLLGSRENDPIFFGDEIETELLPDGAHRLVRIAAKAPLAHHNWLVPRHFVESADFEKYCTAIIEAGGAWERALGGILLVHVPHDSTFDAEAELDKAIAAAKTAAPDW